MKFENTFTVAAPPGRVWGALMDVERIAPCMPGAEVLERTGDDAYQIRVRVKLGPMALVYQGLVEITSRDETGRTAAMRVRARETRGQGSADATVEIELSANGAGTRATMATELRLSGRAAAMGQGVINDVSKALVDEFAGNLERLLAEGGGAPAAPRHAAIRGPDETSTPERGALDAGQLARRVIASRMPDSRASVLALAAAVVLAIGFVLGRARGRGR